MKITAKLAGSTTEHTITHRVKTTACWGMILGCIGALAAPTFLWLVKGLLVVGISWFLFYLAMTPGESKD